MPKRKKENTDQALSKISAERNFEAWPIFQPSDSRSELKVRRYERSTQQPDGHLVTAAVDVGFSNLGVLTTEDQKVFYGLVRMWEDEGRPETLRFSLRALARTLKRSWGAKVPGALSLSLRRLANTPLSWFNAYFDSNTQRRLNVLEEVKVLSHLRIAEAHDERDRITTQMCEARFHDLIGANLRGFYTKPLIFETVIGFESGIALMLYRHLDLVLADKDRYVRRTKELFEDIGLEGGEYRKLSARKRTLERAFKELDGAPLSTGRLKVGKFELTSDEKDAKAVFTKTKLAAATLEEGSATSSARDRTLESDGAEQEASDLIRMFHHLFHGVATERCTPRVRESAQARKLISEHGAMAARFVVEFAFAEARRTNFRPANFGAVLQYVDRALAQLRSQEKGLELLD
jgi:hypothetical protein